MSIEFHCEHCGHKVRAPRKSAGHRGKCPFCGQSVYIPTPVEEIEILDLAPEDESEEQRRRRLEQEALAIEREILHAREETPADDDASATTPQSPPAARQSPEQLVLQYLIALKNTRPDQAESILTRLKIQPRSARETVERMLADPTPPPELQDLPPNLYTSFLRKLASLLK